MKNSLVAVYTLACLLAISAAGSAQEFRGTINGVATDSTGSAVANVKVVATETRTGTTTPTITDGSGNYTIPFLVPGEYEVRASAPGFKEFVRAGLQLSADEHQTIDLPLQVGDASQTVEVTAAVSLVNSENSTVGQTITTQQVEDLPLNGRTPLTLAALSIGVLATGQPSLIHPFDSAGAAGWSIGGSPSQTNEILIDGSPDATWDGRLAYSPPTDAVAEVRVKAFDTDASFGHTSGGTMNQILKNGTNELHGSLWEFNQPNTLSANNFFNNQKGLPNPVTHYNQYGLSVGGPVWIPHIYNGKNKLFFFFAWEGLKDSQPNTTFLSVPTDAERAGNFSALLRLANGTQYQLYNPYTAVTKGTTISRSAFAGNLIPAGYQSPIALATLKYFPEPNIASAGSGFDNFGATAPTVDDYNNHLGRLDYNVSDRDRIFFDIRHTDYLQTKNNYFGNGTTESLLTRNNFGGSIDNVFTVTPTNLVDLRLNFTRMNETHPSPTAGFDPSTLRLPSYLASSSIYRQFPYITFASNTATQALGNNSSSILPSQSLQLYGSWVTIKGSHTLKFGGDIRQYVLNVTSYGNSVGNIAFSGNTWVRASSSASSTVVQGQDLAEFLMGLPTGGTYDVNASGSFYEHYFGAFAQDDWRVRPNLSVNIGLRFDRDDPYVEKYDRTVNGFNPLNPNPIALAAEAAYGKNPIPQIPAANFGVPGGLSYPTNGQVYNQLSHPFSPRVGFAWTPDALKGKTVLRGGFAMFVQPTTITQLAINGTYSTNPILTQEGFSQSTALNPSNNNYVTPYGTLANPFPAGISQPVGSSLGAATFLGQNISVVDANQKDPYSLRWNFDIQHSLTKNTLLEVAYVGSHFVHVPVYATQLNAIPAQYLSTLTVRDAAVNAALTATAKNPFMGLATAQNGTSTTVAQLLVPYPQYPLGNANGNWSGSSGVVEYNNPIGSSYFQSLNVHVEHRYSAGVSIIGNYIRSKLIEKDTWLNATDAQPEKRISPFDHPNRFVVGVVAELPIGKGRHFDIKSRWLDTVVGGWDVNTIYTYQTGAPITWVNGSTTAPGDYVLSGTPVTLDNRQTNSAAFNVSAFDTKSADQFAYHVRTFSTTFPNLRQDGINEWSPSVTKRFMFKEKIYFQFRGEAYNVFNHAAFAAPNTTATNSGFGLITSQANRPRTLQVGARFVF